MSRTIETHSARNPRLLLFHGIVIALIAILAGGMAYRQLLQTVLYSERERQQNQRRVVIPGPRGNIYDRNGNLLVGNRARFSAVLNLAEPQIRAEFRAEYQKVKKNYGAFPATERPTPDQLSRIARASVVQRYLDKINAILGRQELVRNADLNRHISQMLLLPYVLINDLAPEEYARLVERLPVNSPLQVYATSDRFYPYHNSAAQMLGYTSIDSDPDVEDFGGEDLLTFKMKGSFGRDGLEKQFDDRLQGETGGAIYLVDPAGYKVGRPIEQRLPVQGKNIVTSIDIELQQAAEKAMEGQKGAAVALDVRTGEVLALVSKPDYDLNRFVPKLTNDTYHEIEEAGGWLNRAIAGQYPPGSTFKIITAIAGLRAGVIEPGVSMVDCPGFIKVGERTFPCAHRTVHGKTDLLRAISQSCNVFFIKHGLETTPQFLAAEAKRFGFNHATGIELPGEFSSPRVADPDWRKANWKSVGLPDGIWRGGDTANISIGQGDTLITPLQAACMVASFARGETETKPTLLHDPKRPRMQSPAIGLSPAQYNAVLEGMKQCYQFGTGRLAKVEGLTGAAKSGTAQKGRIEIAWLVCFAPAEDPRIAVAVALEGGEDENFGGGVHSGPVVNAVLQAWKEQRERPATPAPVKVTLE
jgi:penicillin-binding protein 2